jgi:hypothetical protein
MLKSPFGQLGMRASSLRGAGRQNIQPRTPNLKVSQGFSPPTIVDKLGIAYLGVPQRFVLSVQRSCSLGYTYDDVAQLCMHQSFV